MIAKIIGQLARLNVSHKVYVFFVHKVLGLNYTAHATSSQLANRVREFAEYQWRKLKEEPARDKASFMLSLKEITDM